MPAWLIPAIGAGVSLLENVLGSSAQAKQNEAARQFSLDMYNRQRQDALSDWQMQNTYNSPVEQMKRLKAAGLNPALVYGNGATTVGGSVRQSSVDAYRPTAFRPDLSQFSNSLSAYYDIKIKEQQLDNLRTANTVAQQDAALRAAQVLSTQEGTANTRTDTARRQFDLDLAQSLRETSVEAAKAGLRKLQTETDISLSANERAAAMNAQTLQKGAIEILNLRKQGALTDDQRREIEQRIRNLQKDERLKQLDINLRRLGMGPGTPFWLQMLGQLLGSAKPSMEFPNEGARKYTDSVNNRGGDPFYHLPSRK